MKILLVRKATGNHLVNSTSPRKNSEPCLSFLLRSKSRMQRRLRGSQLRPSMAAGLIYLIYTKEGKQSSFLVIAACNLVNY